MRVEDPYFFGYGSLVNRRTHSYDKAHPAQVSGWRRAWRATALRDAAFLTVVPDSGTRIDGMIAEVPGGDWGLLDERERAYERHDAAGCIIHPLDTALDVRLYAIAPERHFAPTDTHPILLSYLDVVAQGYLAEYGPDGLQRFVETTDGWDAPILDDRAAPVYPRAQRLSAGDRALVDDLVAGMSANRRRAL